METSTEISNDEFVMKDSKTIHFIVCGFLFMLSGVIFFNLFWNNQVQNNHAAKEFLSVILIACLIFGTINLLNALKQKTILVINSTGIYSMGELKTSWENFINARMVEIQNTSTYSVTYKVFVQYYKVNEMYESEITILDSYDSSAEEVIDAIKKFNKYPVAES